MTYLEMQVYISYTHIFTVAVCSNHYINKICGETRDK